ncbi:hypothetical protein PINS_up006203 [Pythium insidiosum]|nr:hypothetical protein PINS_up006203 [Pythium insidiosum]
MLVDSPIEWAEIRLPVGQRIDVLQQGKTRADDVARWRWLTKWKAGTHAHLGLIAQPRGDAVVVGRVARDDSKGTSVYGAIADEVTLPHVALESNDFRFVAWSACETNEDVALLAVATTSRVEVWQVSQTLECKMIGVERGVRIRSLAWNPQRQLLLVHEDRSYFLLRVNVSYGDTAMERLSSNIVSKCSREVIKHVSWSPCGTAFASSSGQQIHVHSWRSLDDVPVTEASMSSFPVHASTRKDVLGEVEPQLGAVVALTLVSPRVLAAATDTQLLLHESISLTPSAKGSSTIAVTPDKPITIAPSSNISSDLSDLTSMSSPGDAVIDLTSLRITTTSRTSLLQVLNSKGHPSQANSKPPASATPHRCSHLAIFTCTRSGCWMKEDQLALPELTTPDILQVQGMRALIGSSISRDIAVVHLNHDDIDGWSIERTGELELAQDQCCRGLRLQPTSPFVEVVSTQKVKRTFFHASTGAQRLFMSRFKVPRRARCTPPAPPNPPAPTTHDLKSTGASLPTMPHSDVSLIEILVRIEEMQKQMIERFNRVEDRLNGLEQRLDHAWRR